MIKQQRFLVRLLQMARSNLYPMDLHVTKNIQFTRLIKAPAQQREFNFRRVPNTAVDTFHIDVSDDKMNRIMFQVQKDPSGHWKIVDNSLPVWISNVECKLDEILENEPLLRKHIAPLTD